MAAHVGDFTAKVIADAHSRAVQRRKPWLAAMRSVPLMLLAALLIAPAPAAHAQDDTAPPVTIPSLPRAPAPTGPERQGPELDVFRDPAPGQAPAQQTPVIQVPPPVIAPPVATQSPATRAEPSRPAAPRETPVTERRAPAPSARPAPATAPAPAPSDVAPDTAPQDEVAVQPEPAPQPEAEPAAEPTPTPDASAPTESKGAPWPWIVGGLLLLLVLAAAALRRRRNRADLALPAPAGPDQAIVPPAAPEPAPRPAPSPTPPPAQTADRPHLALTLEVEGARLSLMGATVTYRLAVTNSGADEARDILVRGLIANASAPMDDLLKPFFAGEAGLAIHSVPALAPGETVHLKSELRLNADQIAPISAGARALLIPLLAFDARYGWDAENNGVQGRTGRAFIVGQEQEPPTERLSPFRLDLGPRQFRRPAARATALILDA